MKWFTDGRFGMFIRWGLDVHAFTAPKDGTIVLPMKNGVKAAAWLATGAAVPAAALLAVAVLAALSSTVRAAEPPKPYGPVPSERQIVWHGMEFYGFVHFTTNTFTDKEWGFGDEKESVFNPTAFDAEQIVGACAEAGMTKLILTCKHHDGFCLWPSPFTEHSVKNSPFRGGKGDVVKEIADACRKHGLKFGVYLSPWDRNHKDYGTPAYITYYRNQMRELLTRYGTIHEAWLDGANGGDGWYGGTRERRNIDRTTYYGWPETWKMIHQLQPMAAIFSDVGPDCRWAGNEHGTAGDPCWATISTDGWYPGQAPSPQLNSGQRNGKLWIPAEVDVSIRPGWFYHASEDNRVRTPDNLMTLYFESVGRGANLLLNVPPDRRGLVHENDVRSLKEFGRRLRETFGTDLAKGATATASNVRGGDPKFGPQKLLDGDRETYWATDDSSTTPEVTLSFKEPVTFNIVRLREAIRLGQRVDDWALDAWVDGAWKEFAKGTAIGACRLVRTAPLTTAKVRLRITKSPVCPAIAEFGLFREADGGGGPAAAKLDDGISKAKWKVVSTSFDGSGGNGANAIDGKPNTLWHTHGADGEHALPQEIVVDMGGTVNVKGFTCLPRQDGCPHGMVDKYEFYLSADGKEWSKAAEGEFANIRANPILQAVTLAAPAKARYFKFVATHAVEKNHAALAELGILAD